MKTFLLPVILPLLWLSACQSAPVPPVGVKHPDTSATALTQAQAEFKADHLGKAWVLAANQGGSSAENVAFQASLQAAFEQKLTQAKTGGPSRRWQDLEATLSLMKNGHWTAPSVAAATPTGGGPGQWLKGTATVFVNRGLRLEGGGGFTDLIVGSGFFISDDGYFLTNNHVIESLVDPKAAVSSRFWIELPNAKGIKTLARVVGWDRNLDLALLKVDAKPGYVFTLSAGPDPVPGQKLQAIGSPGGLEQTMTAGIASAQKRPLLSIGAVIQIDVPVNPGNSGGPLLDESGQVVGVVFAGVADFRGVNFAIPASLVQKDLPRLRVGGAAVLPWIGLGLQEDETGLEVLYVTPQSPGDSAGIRVGDRLTGVAGVPVKEIDEAQVRLLDFGTEAVIPLDVVRGGKPLVLWTTLDQRPEFPFENAAKTDLVAKLLPLAFGAVVKDIGHGTDRSFTITKVWPGSTADDLSLAEGDAVEVHQWVVNSKEHLLRTEWTIHRKAGKGQVADVKPVIGTAIREFL